MALDVDGPIVLFSAICLKLTDVSSLFTLPCLPLKTLHCAAERVICCDHSGY